MAKRGLGRGLEALITGEVAGNKEQIVEVEVDRISRGAHQVRQKFDEEGLKELAASIAEHGVVQPIVVRPVGEGQYELVAGERRWRAGQLAGLKVIPAVVKDLSDRETTEMALVENVQREDLTAIEEARAYKLLMEEFGLTQEEVARRVGKSRVAVSNAVRLLGLPVEVQEMVEEGRLTPGHARVLAGLEDEKLVKVLADKVAGRGLSVRELERMARGWKEDRQRKRSAGESRHASELAEMEERLQSALGVKVKIKFDGSRGKIEIEYYSWDDLERVAELILGGSKW